jgi:hypothetical protein
MPGPTGIGMRPNASDEAGLDVQHAGAEQSCERIAQQRGRRRPAHGSERPTNGRRVKRQRRHRLAGRPSPVHKDGAAAPVERYRCCGRML